MNDTPGRPSPGSPSDGHQPSGRQEPGMSGSGPRADGAGADSAASGPKWSEEQPPPAQWSAPGGTQAPGQVPPSSPAPGGPGGPGAAGAPGPGHSGQGGPSGYGGWGAPGGYGGQGGWGAGPGGQGGHGGYGPPPPGGYAGPDGPAGPYGGWGGPWGPPPAAKPGVIPLRPLGVGEILDGAVSTMRAHWRTVLGISLAVAVVVQTILVLLDRFVLDPTAAANTLGDPNVSLDEAGRAMGDSLLTSGTGSVISLLGTVLATALLTTVTSNAVLGRPVTARRAWQDARPQLPGLLGLMLLLPLIATVIVAVGVLPGIVLILSGTTEGGIMLAFTGGLAAFVVVLWLIIRFSLASPALMLEKQGVRKAMSRSAKLVRGSWWRVFGIQFLASIIAGIVAAIIVLPFAFLAMWLDGDGLGGFVEGGGISTGWTFLVVSGIGSVIGSMLTLPLTACVTVLLYIDRRIRREALDLALVGAAASAGNASAGTAPDITPRS